MLVLAIDTQAHRKEDSQTIIGQTATLAATPEEAVRLSLAASAGELRLLLKTPGDQSKDKPISVKLDDLDKPIRKVKDKEEPEQQPTEVASEKISWLVIADSRCASVIRPAHS